MTAELSLPALPDRARLAELCQETAGIERFQPAAIEKDVLLTQLIWGLGQLLGDGVLLKGGTLLSKVDLGFRRMSEDVDLVLPSTGRRSTGGTNARVTNRVRDALRKIAPVLGLTFPVPSGQRSEKNAHVLWELPYASTFGPQAIVVEASIRPALAPPRRVRLLQLLADPAVDDRDAFCWALDAAEARAEKVRAALTREPRAIRDFYDLEELRTAGFDLSSAKFIALVEKKLAEVEALSFRKRERKFSLGSEQILRLEADARSQLASVLRYDAPAFALGAMLEHFEALWNKG